MIHVSPFGNPESSIIYYIDFGVRNYLARIAVPFFFTASGFFLFRKTSWDNFDPKVPIKYVKHIFFLYIIWTIIYLPISIHYIKNNEMGISYGIKEYLRDCIFQGSFNHLWYLTALIFAVILVSFLIYKKVKIKYIVIAASIFYFIGLFAQSWFGFITPLREATPQLWSFLKLVQKVIVTTRDGLFEGFLFVSIGMCFAFCNITITKTKALIGFALSMAAMLFEVFILVYYKIPREFDIFLFLVPATFFMFAYVLQVDLADGPIYKNLRLLSALIYYSHFWVIRVVTVLLKKISVPLANTCLCFILSLAITLIFSAAVIKLSNTKKFKFLKILY